MLDALSTPHNRTFTFVFLAACCASAIGAGAVGVSDNPPGILLAYVAAAALLLALVHPWRTPRQFRYLFYASILGFVFFGIVHNVFDAVVSESANASALHSLLEGLGDAAFLLAVFGCPPAFLISGAGWLVTSDPKPPGRFEA